MGVLNGERQAANPGGVDDRRRVHTAKLFAEHAMRACVAVAEYRHPFVARGDW